MALNLPDKPWWETDRYDGEDAVPSQLEAEADKFYGPKELGLVRAYLDGQTQQGWGLIAKKGDAFMPRYMRGEFLPRRALYGYEQGKHGFAFVMRSCRLIVVDIDGKNGGLQYAPSLGNLPFTLAETSKSGTGYHLWYYADEPWNADEGFGMYPDRIGIVQGVDIRSVGCVYHFDTQRWNSRSVAPAPQWLLDRLLEHKQKQQAAAARITNTLNTLDETDILLMHADLIEELKKPIKPGQRNTTLFAIGGKMKTAQVDKWQKHVMERGLQIGLDTAETERIIENIEKYG